MHFAAKAISDHRLQRIHRWAMLWLKWFAAFLEAASAYSPLSPQAERIAHCWLDWIERLVVSIVIVRASYRMRPLRLKRLIVERGGRRTPKRRAILGLRLRRELRCADLGRRIAALSQSIDSFVARMIRRLPRGLTRRRPSVFCTHARAPVRLLFLGMRRLTADTS